MWFLGVWQTGEVARVYSASLFPDENPACVCGSCFAITGYEGHFHLGGTPALLRSRYRLHSRGLLLMLDFIPNHTAPDHPWVSTHPDYYVHGTESDFARKPQDYERTSSGIVAHGRIRITPGGPIRCN